MADLEGNYSIFPLTVKTDGPIFGDGSTVFISWLDRLDGRMRVFCSGQENILLKRLNCCT